MFHKTTPDLQDQDQDRFFLVSDQSCPKTDGLSPHHWCGVDVVFEVSRAPCCKETRAQCSHTYGTRRYIDTVGT